MPAAASVDCYRDGAPRGAGPSLATASEARRGPIDLRPAERWPNRRPRTAVQTIRDWPRLYALGGLAALIPAYDVHLIHARPD